MGAREWEFLACADGTRDLEGIRLAARGEARISSGEHIATFFEQLGRAGMLREGPPPGADPIAHDVAAGTPAKRLVALPHFQLRCDGGGTCCRLYPTVTFLPLDVARARALCPEVLLGVHHPERVFTPLVSASAPSWQARAVTMVDGRCAYLDEKGSCSVHAAGAAELKPRGCRAFPMRYVDDGSELRVAPVPECRCVFTSPRVVTRTTAPPVRDEATFVEVLPNVLDIDGEQRWPRIRYLQWATNAAAQLEREEDGVHALWHLAERLSPLRPSLREHVARFGASLRRHNARQQWRHATDLARLIPRWMQRATHSDAAPPPRASENLYLRTIAHAHAWALDDIPLAESLRERALRLWLARRLPAAIDDDHGEDAALDEPIALVEACSRAFHLSTRNG